MRSSNISESHCHFNEPSPELSEGSGEEKSINHRAKDFSRRIAPLEMTTFRIFQRFVL